MLFKDERQHFNLQNFAEIQPLFFHAQQAVRGYEQPLAE
ncbi:hypothetical protein AM305_00514 [Actinobacillus minor NM305]|uniref:Uncharacterized protein n=1 Tax=Actinobacillus minor NM305 TaxID=637911 RepID=C5S3P5_9PAST|nr:hypothetical protein AM305_00514 [Actinobacillus minor NM305]